MHEYVLVAAVWGNKTKTFRLIKPLNCSCNHVVPFY
jgi:hypothetical protein